MPGPDRSSAGERMLLVSYNFPPLQSAGALRWQKFAAALANRGIALDVLMGAPKGRTGRLEDVAGVPPGTRIFAVPDASSRLTRVENSGIAALRRLTGAGRSTGKTGGGGGRAAGEGEVAGGGAPGSIPPEDLHWFPRSVRDARRAYWILAQYEEMAAWAASAARIGRDLVRDNRYRAVLTSGPPHGAHLAGRTIARTAAVPLVLDFRDPWSLRRRVPEGYAHPLYFSLAHALERSVVRSAGWVVLNTPAVLDAMRRRYPDRADRMVCILNGFDETFEPAEGDGEFRIVYAGAIYLDRDPRPLFAALALLQSDPSVDLTGVYLDLVGNVAAYDGVPTERLAAAAGVGSRVRVHASLPREALYRRLREAAVLVSLPQDSPWAIPSKVFEYMGFHSWILAFAEDGSPTERILAETDADVVAPGDVEATARVLKRRLAEFRSGIRPGLPVHDDRFSRAAQSRKLLELLAHPSGPR